MDNFTSRTPVTRRRRRIVKSESALMSLFTSRRRNTRLSFDWSSDVCSSDLEHTSELQSHDKQKTAYRLSCDWSSDVCSRSEERRVGKTARSRWVPYPYK